MCIHIKCIEENKIMIKIEKIVRNGEKNNIDASTEKAFKSRPIDIKSRRRWTKKPKKNLVKFHW